MELAFLWTDDHIAPMSPLFPRIENPTVGDHALLEGLSLYPSSQRQAPSGGDGSPDACLSDAGVATPQAQLASL